MAEKKKNKADKVQGLKTMLGKSSGASVKDQVKAALMKNKNKAQNAAQSSENKKTTPPPSHSDVNANVTPILSKIGKTVDSINEVHSTMENLNKNMNIFVDIFNKRGGSLSSGGGGSQIGQENFNSSEDKSGEQGASSSKSQSGSGRNQAGMMGGSQNPVTSLLLSNLLKKKESESEENLSELKKGSKKYLDLLLKKLDKFQHEYELLQYLFEPKMLGEGLKPTEDAQGNAAWLSGFMSMMLNKRK